MWHECCRHWSLQDGRVRVGLKYGAGNTTVECPCACHIEFRVEVREMEDEEQMERAAKKERKRHERMAIARRLDE